MASCILEAPVDKIADSLYVAAGAAIGANARYWLGVIAKAQNQEFPWPTLVINVIGSMLLGAFASASLARGWGSPTRLFFAVGLCGGFTTFSTFSFEVLDLLHNRSWRPAVLYATLSAVLCVGGCWLGAHLLKSGYLSMGDR